jgi:hypothetical protein
MKRFVVIALSLVLIMGLWIPKGESALAANAATDLIVQPYFTHINIATCGMDINSSGKASMSSTMIAYSSVDKVRLKNYLQRYDNGSWTTIKSWSQTTEGTRAFWSKTYYVNSGYYYRLKTYFYTYNGSTIIESTSATSSNVYY